MANETLAYLTQIHPITSRCSWPISSQTRVFTPTTDNTLSREPEEDLHPGCYNVVHKQQWFKGLLSNAQFKWKWNLLNIPYALKSITLYYYSPIVNNSLSAHQVTNIQRIEFHTTSSPSCNCNSWIGVTVIKYMNPPAVEPTNIETREARWHTFRSNIPIGIYNIRQLDSDEVIQRTHAISGRQ